MVAGKIIYLNNSDSLSNHNLRMHKDLKRRDLVSRSLP